MTSFENVYYEETEGYKGIGVTEHAVVVAIRRWYCDFSPLQREDAILHTLVIVDYEVAVNSRKFLRSGEELSWYQRQGIAKYDQLIADHPVYGQPKKQSLSA